MGAKDIKDKVRVSNEKICRSCSVLQVVKLVGMYEILVSNCDTAKVWGYGSHICKFVDDTSQISRELYKQIKMKTEKIKIN